MSDPELQRWYQVYSLAMVEAEPDRLRELVFATDTAIYARLQELQASSDHHEERQMITDALRNLQMLRTEARYDV